MTPEMKEYIDDRIDDMVIQRSASYFQVMEKMIAEMNRNILSIMKILNKIVK